MTVWFCKNMTHQKYFRIVMHINKHVIHYMTRLDPRDSVQPMLPLSSGGFSRHLPQEESGGNV